MSFGSEFLVALSESHKTGVLSEFLNENISSDATWISLTKSSLDKQLRNKEEWLDFVINSKNYHNYDNSKGYHNFEILYENDEIIVWRGWDDLDAWLAIYELEDGKVIRARHARGTKG